MQLAFSNAQWWGTLRDLAPFRPDLMPGQPNKGINPLR